MFKMRGDFHRYLCEIAKEPDEYLCHDSGWNDYKKSVKAHIEKE